MTMMMILTMIADQQGILMRKIKEKTAKRWKADEEEKEQEKKEGEEEEGI